MRVLVVEDEPDLLGTLVQAMREEGHAVDEAADGEEALYKAVEWDYDAIILDVMLPRMDGFEVLKRLRQKKKTPVLMLTARTKVNDRIQGLDSGADDYILKPVDLDELAARVRALIRRSQGDASHLIRVGEVEVDTSARKATLGGQPVALTGREYALLEFMVSRRGKIVSRTDLYEHLHDENDTPMSNLVDVHVFNLRKKFGAAFITTLRGQGYSIEA
ncbi:response regulator transcription factor [Luteolibacter ambystomatis]|uniref:Response regulator transcription factor n=1 Tax=Luteolibacter ambystomatis TaxID=2824561 RepID=A0A975G9M8_9BACT|nr:response regulator transcription factor [Luteolibacter ambystomatis]QUE51383.1 response regulator transcription factor [Luteolibacter ambystomatis]